MKIYDELKARGLIAQVTDEELISNLINEGKATFYIGFDPTADSLHVGHFMALCLMKRLQMAGNKPIALIGGGTGYIGDPSGRTDMRSMMTPEQIQHNCDCFKEQMSKFIDFSEGKAMMVNNADWLLDLNYIESVSYTHLDVYKRQVLVAVGKFIMDLGPIGAGLYGFFNRLLIPFGLHHALNSVFWFDVAGINDIAKFWGNAEGGVMGTTGMYMAGFFPVMMFGLPAAALAMYHTAKDTKKKAAAGLLMSVAVASFFNGVTEPLEFSFMFLAPALYGVHAVLTGISMAVVAALPVRAGFNFSAGLVDWILSFKAPFAQNPLLLIPIGLAVGAVYYVVFRFVIVKFNMKTPGREDDNIDETKVELANNDFTGIAKIVLEGVGGPANVTSIDNCITRLRLEIKDYTLIDEHKIKSAGVAGVIRPSKTAVQVIIGTKVQFVADEFKKLCK